MHRSVVIELTTDIINITVWLKCETVKKKQIQ